jgi:anti-sigma regulatory factor (Ser/Thr protein kinase)
VNDGPPDAPVDVGDVGKDHTPQPDTWRVTVPEVGDIRRRVRAAARDAGLDPDHVDRFTVAVNEVVINALQHGGGVAVVAIEHDAGVLVTVADRGPGLVLDRPVHLPPADQEHGRGLWLVHRLCDDVTIDRGPGGTRVRLRARPAA